jgi:hypothetical protein
MIKSAQKKITILSTAIAILVVIVAALVGITYMQVQKLPVVNDPETFARNFNPTGKQDVKLHIGGWVDRVIHSPLFPYVELKGDAIVNEILQGKIEQGKDADFSTGGVSINTDPFWKIFWVEKSPPGEYTKFYGPYRLGTK